MDSTLKDSFPSSGRPVAITTPEMIKNIHKMVIDNCTLKVSDIAETTRMSTERVLCQVVASFANGLPKFDPEDFRSKIWHCTSETTANFCIYL